MISLKTALRVLIHVNCLSLNATAVGFGLSTWMPFNNMRTTNYSALCGPCVFPFHPGAYGITTNNINYKWSSLQQSWQHQQEEAVKVRTSTSTTVMCHRRGTACHEQKNWFLTPSLAIAPTTTTNHSLEFSIAKTFDAGRGRFAGCLSFVTSFIWRLIFSSSSPPRFFLSLSHFSHPNWYFGYMYHVSHSYTASKQWKIEMYVQWFIHTHTYRDICICIYSMSCH